MKLRAPPKLQDFNSRSTRDRLFSEQPQALQATEDNRTRPGDARFYDGGQREQAGRRRRPLRRRDTHERLHTGAGAGERTRGLLRERGNPAARLLGPRK